MCQTYAKTDHQSHVFFDEVAYETLSRTKVGDFNAHLGMVNSKAVGTWQAEHEDKVGEIVHDILLKHRLFVPSTMEKFHTGDKYDGRWVSYSSIQDSVANNQR